MLLVVRAIRHNSKYLFKAAIVANPKHAYVLHAADVIMCLCLSLNVLVWRRETKLDKNPFIHQILR